MKMSIEVAKPGVHGSDFIPETVHLLSEDDYDSYMNKENREWREQNVEHGDFKAHDGLSIRYYHARKAKSRGTIVMLHGYCGFFGKFHELSEYFWRAGYEVFFLEQRGHGYSGREIEATDMVHVRDYNDYVQDLKLFMDEIVKPSINDKSCVLYAHSMGGAVGALFLEQHPGYFDSAILSCPMFAIKTGGVPNILIWLLRAKIRLLHQEKAPFPGGKHWDGVPVYESSSAMSKARYMHIFNQRLADSHYHTNMLSNGWGAASFRAMKRIFKNIDKIDIPILLFNSGNDSFVEASGHYDFFENTPKTKLVIYENAKHELFNATDEIRRDYFSRIFEFLL